MYSLFHSRAQDESPAVEPAPNPFPQIEGAEIAAEFLGERMGGDLYDSIRVSPERVLFGLLDVAGRREDNRSILSTAQETFRGLGAELFSGSDINESDAMSELCLRINRHIIEASSGVHPCPAFIGCYHEKFGTLCYTNAGHTPGLLRDGAGISELPSTGLPLGLFSHATCEAPTVGLEKGASVLLVSRGVVEFGRDHDKSSEELGLERVKEFFQAAPTASAQAVCTALLNAVSKFHTESQPDDRTALALLRKA